MRPWIWLPITGLVLAGCKSSSPSGSARQVNIATPAGPVPNPRELAAPAASPAPGTCPGDFPVLCADGCCPLGTVCAAGGGCDTAPMASNCPAEAPVRCDTAGANDSSPMGNPASFTSPAGFGVGRFGTGASARSALISNSGNPDIEGCAQTVTKPYITTTTKDFPSGEGPITMEAWVRTSCRYNQMIFDYGRGLEISAGAGGQTSVVWRYLESGVPQSRPGSCAVTSTAFVQDGAWHHLAVAYGYSSGDAIRIYVDGTQVGSCMRAVLATIPFQRLAIGSGRSVTECVGTTECVAGNAFAGEIDEVRILNYAATAEQIADSFRNGPPTAISGTVGLWHFDEADVERSWCCPAGSSCGRGGDTCTQPNSGTSCPASAPLVCPDGCCPSGTTCTEVGCAMPTAGANPCADAQYPVTCRDFCCPNGNTCMYFSEQGGSTGCGNGDGGVDPVHRCPDGTSPCGANCCPSGTTCSGSTCVQAAPVPHLCTNATTCGQSCCGTNFACGPGGDCVSAPPVPPSNPCPTGYAGRSYRGLVVCHFTGTRPPRGGPGGPACGDNVYCEATQSCAAPGACCDTAKPRACGASCCLADATCTEGRCGAPIGETVCGGNVTCGANVRCAGNACAPTCPADSPTPCGGKCCARGIACEGGACKCPDGYPVPCEINCCLSGATCGAGGDCGCPPGRAPCGDLCCNAGLQCTGGRCVEAPQGGSGCAPVGAACGPNHPTVACCSIFCKVNVETGEGVCGS